MIKLNELEVYNVAMDIGELIRQSVIEWPYFEKDTLGKQVARAADSIALNISEGYGRYHYGENKISVIIAMGQLTKCFRQ